VLEVGAGIGATTRALREGGVVRWACLEPDASLAGRLSSSLRLPSSESGTITDVIVGTTADLPGDRQYDAVLYIDVLEHIEDDQRELATAAALLRTGGHLVVVSPAHQWLFSPFDRAIGHHRRYSRASLESIVPPGLSKVRLRYLDSVGMLASLANRFLMKSGMPRSGQLAFWDRILVPCSRPCDALLGYRFGKTLLGVWVRERTGAQASTA